MDNMDEVIIERRGSAGIIRLNRPKALNSLTLPMVRAMASALGDLADDPAVASVIVKGEGERGFCAGGDIRLLHQSGKEGSDGAETFWREEFRLNHAISHYSKPYVVLMDGITMGGGVGLSIHAPFRVATERTVFAMPETTIGFFPDVGASFFLPRMPGAVGTYLALTSSRLTGANVFYSGVATHYLHSTSLPALESRLAELRFADYDDLPTRLHTINATIEEFVTGLPHDEPIQLAGQLRLAIDRCFGHDSVDEILRALEAEAADGSMRGWARDTLATLHKRSPTAVHVALRQMRIGGKWSIRDTFTREHAIASKFMAHPDFTEGVSALLLEKRPANWQPASLEDIKPEDSAKLTEGFFLAPKGQKALELLTEADYTEYPGAEFGVPTEKNVEKRVALGKLTRDEVVDEFVREKGGKQGVREVVGEILERKTKMSKAQGLVTWKY